MTPFEPALPILPLSESVSTDVACRKCGYNLRSLRLDGVCPECGTAVMVSIQGDLLRFSDPAWIRLLSRGMRLILWGIVSYILAVIALVVLLIALPGAILSITMLSKIVFLAASAIMVVGSWLITMPDPSGTGEDRYGMARKIIRITLVIGVGQSVIDLGITPQALSPELRQLFQIFALLCTIVSVVGLYAQLKYLGSIAGRIPNESLARRAAMLKRYFVGSYGAMMVLTLVTALLVLRGQRNTTSAGFATCFTSLLGLTALVFGVMYILFIENMSKQLKEQVVLAEQNWAGHAAGPTAPPMV